MAKGRFVVVDYGQVVHQRNVACPPWCHLCPHMEGGVMPHCFGTAVRSGDEYDLMHCTCDPNDPIVGHVDLIARTTTLADLLRERRRVRLRGGNLLRRLATLTSAMKVASVSAQPIRQRHAWAEAEELVSQVLRDLLEPATAADAVDPSVTDSGTLSTRD